MIAESNCIYKSKSRSTGDKAQGKQGKHRGRFSVLNGKDAEPSPVLKQTDPNVAQKKVGVATVSHSGCGVVATYNALYTLGEPRSFDSILRHYNSADNALILWGLMGISPDAIAEYFVNAGYSVCMSSNPNTTDALSKLARANILYYVYTYPNSVGGKSIGHHFVEYHQTNSGAYEAANVYTNKSPSYFASPSQFSKDNSVLYVSIHIF